MIENIFKTLLSRGLLITDTLVRIELLSLYKPDQVEKMTEATQHAIENAGPPTPDGSPIKPTI